MPTVFSGEKKLVANIKISILYINIQPAFHMVEVEERLLPVVRPVLPRVQHDNLVLVSFLLPPGAMSL